MQALIAGPYDWKFKLEYGLSPPKIGTSDRSRAHQATAQDCTYWLESGAGGYGFNPYSGKDCVLQNASDYGVGINVPMWY